MKKLIFITLILCASGMMAQSTLDHGANEIVSDLYLVGDSITGGDTSFTYYFPYDARHFSVQGNWTHTGGSGYLYFYVSNDNGDFALYDSNATDTLTGTDTTFFFDSGANFMTWRYVKFTADTVDAVLNDLIIYLK